MKGGEKTWIFPRWALGAESLKKNNWLRIGYIGDEILPSFVGDYFINHDICGSLLTNQYFMESKILFRGSLTYFFSVIYRGKLTPFIAIGSGPTLYSCFIHEVFLKIQPG